MQTGGSAGQPTTRVHASSSMTKSGPVSSSAPRRPYPYKAAAVAIPASCPPRMSSAESPTIIAVPGSTPWRSMSRANIPALESRRPGTESLHANPVRYGRRPRASSRRRVTSSGFGRRANNWQPRPDSPLEQARCRGAPGFHQRAGAEDARWMRTMRPDQQGSQDPADPADDVFQKRPDAPLVQFGQW